MIEDLAWIFCKEDTNEGALDPDDPDGRQASFFDGICGNALEIAVIEVRNCKPAKKVQEYSCQSLVYGAWKQCYHNLGRGGAVDWDCLRYSVRPYWAFGDSISPVKEWTANEMDEDIINGVNFYL